MTDRTPRWHYRFQNFDRAVALLRDAVETGRTRPLSRLEEEGTVQRFEYTWELGWKVLKDFLEAQGTGFETVTPASVIRAGLAARVLSDGDTWMRALDARNGMSHSYSEQALARVMREIAADYLPLLDALHAMLAAELARQPGG